jgi:hypothetical protein
MKYIITLLLLCSFQMANAQENTNNLNANKMQGGSALAKTVDISKLPWDFAPEILNVDHHPIPAAEYANKKDILLARRLAHKNTSVSKKLRASAPNPIMVKGFHANVTNSTPLDNDIAVNNDGQIVSVINSNMRVHNDTGKLLGTISIPAMASSIGNFAWVSDPRVLYDPEADRYVIVFFTGDLSYLSQILVGFSKTNNALGAWNFYALNGNSFNDSTFSDYPIIALTKSDLLITFNQVKDNVHWSVGFDQSVIWQIDKQKGYDADSLEFTLWSNIQMNGKKFRNICPAKQQTFPYTDSNYFLSVRNVDFENDSVFLFTLNNSYKSGVAALSYQTLISNKKYGFPPNAIQKNVNNNQQYLMTNDARVLAAIYENDRIYFGSNSVNTQFYNASVYLGTIKNVMSNPTVTADIISKDTIEYAYPSMTYMGTSPNDHKILYSFSHCITQGFPGNSILYKDAQDNYSDIVVTNNGTTINNVLTDSNERWGDYSGIQRSYNKSTMAYMANSSGQSNKLRAWISILQNAEFPQSVTAIENNNSLAVYPNPTSSNISIDFYMPSKQKVEIKILDMNGRHLHTIINDFIKVGNNIFQFSTASLAAGNYILQIANAEKIFATKQFVVQ